MILFSKLKYTNCHVIYNLNDITLDIYTSRLVLSNLNNGMNFFYSKQRINVQLQVQKFHNKF